MQKITSLLIGFALFTHACLQAQQNCTPIPEVNFPGGRVILSFDGNVHDDDDIIALPYAAGLWWAAGLSDKVVQIEYNNHVCDINATETDGTAAGIGDDSENMRTSAQGIIEHFGYDPSVLYDFELHGSSSTEAMAAHIEASNANNKLWIIAGGPMETVWRGLNAATQGHEHVTVISHSAWNEGHVHCSDDHNWTNLKDDFAPLGVYFVGNCSDGDCSDPNELNDQNGEFSSDPINWQWMNTSPYTYNQWIISRDPFSYKIDPSDAGMSYFLITGGPFNGGNKTPDHNDARQLMENPCDDSGHDTDSSNSSGGNCNYDFEEVNGRVIIEAENLEVPSGWVSNSSQSGHSGSGHIEWTGGNSFGAPGNGLTNTSIKINQPGTYKFQWRTKIGHGSDVTESNDSWLRFPDADEFYGMKSDGHIVYPHGSGKTPNPNGTGSDNWFKVYVNSLSWTWSTHTSDHDGHEIYVTFNAPGVYNMQLSGRSNNHVIDRIVLALNPSGSTDLSLEETICTSSGDEEVAVTGISLSPSEITLESGEDFQLNTNFSPQNASNQNVNWSFSNESVAVVNPHGVVSAIGEGTTVVTVTTAEGNYSASCTVHVVAPEEEDNDSNDEESNSDSDTPDSESCNADFLEVDGIVVMEAEQLTLAEGWVFKTEADGYTGTGYISWEGGDQFSTPNGGEITAGIQVQSPGTFKFQWHTKVGEGSNTTESNDTWLRFADADAFYGEKDNGSQVFPRGSGQTPLPNGAGGEGWFKVYSSGGNTDWTWSTYTSDNDGHFIYVHFDEPGLYFMEIAGRSEHHFIDRIVLSQTDIEGSDLSLSSTACNAPETEQDNSKAGMTAVGTSVYEGENLEFVFNLTKAIDEDVLLLVEVQRGTAHANDYRKPDVEGLVIPAGETSAVFTVQTKKDSRHEEDETIYLLVEEVSDDLLGSYDEEVQGVILDDDAPLGIYPNPARANGTVELNGIFQGTYEITLFSMTGEMIKKQEAEINGNYEYHVPNINKGLYILRADNSSKSYSGKLAVK